MSQLRTPYVRQAQCSTLPPAPSSAVRTFPPKVPGKKGKSQLVSARRTSFWPPVPPALTAPAEQDWVRLLSSGAKLVRSSRPRALTRAEVRKHSAPDDCWMVLSGKVYDMTPFMEYHPGGASELMRAAGEDGTALYNEIHPWVNLDFLASVRQRLPVQRHALTHLPLARTPTRARVRPPETPGRFPRRRR